MEAGRHLAWGYVDQGPLTPLLARAMTELSEGSLTVLRVPSALMCAGMVLLTGMLARELGGTRRAELIAAGCTAVGVVFLTTGHLLSTTTFDLLVWIAVTYLAVRAVRRGEERLWPVAGVVLGLGLLNKPLPAFLAAGLLAGVAIAGPRRLIRSPWVWAGAAIALVMWMPWLVWQADHGWPQAEVSRAIAEGGSTSSEPRWAIVPFQFLLVSPPLAPVWIAGLVRLFRDPVLRDLRFFAWTWVALAIAFMATGGKPYYLAGLLPLLLAAGAGAVDGWLERGRRGARRVALGAAFALSVAIGVPIALPVLPVEDIEPVLAANDDVGNTVGWPGFVDQVAAVYRRVPGAVILTSNYGQAGAIDRYGPDLRLPRAYSGHNAYHEWGPPPDRGGLVIVIGEVEREGFRGCTLAHRIETVADLDTEERGTEVWTCRGTARPWSELWPELERFG
ncbi:MAG TPA: glycosyltransferase family 39 protein [Thermoleophilaceae bacterium]